MRGEKRKNSGEKVGREKEGYLAVEKDKEGTKNEHRELPHAMLLPTATGGLTDDIT
jgi:hypothetical protein